MTCRDAVLQAFDALERRHNREAFRLGEIVQEVMASDGRFAEGTIRTHISSLMCADAPVNHGTAYPDLERPERGVYRRIR